MHAMMLHFNMVAFDVRPILVIIHEYNVYMVVFRTKYVLNGLHWDFLNKNE